LVSDTDADIQVTGPGTPSEPAIPEPGGIGSTTIGTHWREIWPSPGGPGGQSLSVGGVYRGDAFIPAIWDAATASNQQWKVLSQASLCDDARNNVGGRNWCLDRYFVQRVS
jgi:hypothetical protein